MRPKRILIVTWRKDGHLPHLLVEIATTQKRIKSIDTLNTANLNKRK